MKKIAVIILQLVLGSLCLSNLILPNVFEFDNWADILMNIISVLSGAGLSISITLSFTLNINSNNTSNKMNNQKAGRNSIQFQIGEINNGK